VRVLVVRIGAMGDVLHAMPAVAALRARQPGCFIGWAIAPEWSRLLQIAGDTEDLSQGVGPAAARALVDRWYSVPTGAWKRRPISGETASEVDVLRRVLKEERFDVCVDLQGAVKSAIVGRMAGAPVFVGAEDPRERLARWMYKVRVPTNAEHVVEQGCELLGAAVGETLLPAPVTLPMDAEDELWADGMVGRQRMCLISPTAGWGAKVWPAERYGAVAAELASAGIKVLVNGSAQGSDEARRVVEASAGAAEAVPCSLGRLTALTRRAAVAIAGDTGPLHLAAALERPVVGIYGPTSPRRNGPYWTGTGKAKVRVLRDAESVTSHKHVSEAEPGMLKIEVKDVVAAAWELVAGGERDTKNIEIPTSGRSEGRL
jgi:heptosyltransferase-1